MKTWLHHIWAKITAPRPYPVVPEDHHPVVNSLNQLQRAGDIDSQQVLARTEKKAEQIKNWTRYQGNEHG